MWECSDIKYSFALIFNDLNETLNLIYLKWYKILVCNNMIVYLNIFNLSARRIHAINYTFIKSNFDFLMLCEFKTATLILIKWLV